MKGWLLFFVAIAWMAVAGRGYWKAFRAPMRLPLRLTMWAASIGFGIAVSLLWYPVETNQRWFGFPLPAAVFLRNDDGSWRDFVNGFTMPFTFLNAAFGAGVALFVLTGLIAVLARKRAARN